MISLTGILCALCLIPAPRNRLRMLEWSRRIDAVVARPPGNDDGFSPKDLARAGDRDLSGTSVWVIVCEEMIDTQTPSTYFEAARQELHKRGITDEEITDMRRFAWLTVGWLNFETMLWDWASLDESDILRAIRWQYSGGWISEDERDQRLEFLNRYR